MTGNELREALRCGKRVYGTAIVSTFPGWPYCVRDSGLDFVFLDTEHTPIDRMTLSVMSHAFREIGLPPIVRIPSPDPYEACKVLDGGACGIVAPYVETVEQVEALVGATKLRPIKGRRLSEALKDKSALEPELLAYIENRNKNNVLTINIESVPAMENLDAILDVPGLDAVLVGPHDLSCSLGIPEQYHHTKFAEAAHTIIRKCRAKNVGVGLHYSEGTDLEIEWCKAGANMVMHSSDISIFSKALKRDLDEIRNAVDAS